MKKLTASIFASLLTVVTVGAANANIASQGYVDEKVTTLNQSIDAKADQSALDTLTGRVSTNEGNISALQTGKLDTDGTAAKATADADGNVITDTYATKTELGTKADSTTVTALDNAAEKIANRVTTVSVASTDQTYPTAKAVWDVVQAETADIASSDDVTALEGRVTTAEGEIDTIQGTMGTYGDIVTKNASDFATAAQGAKADTALQKSGQLTQGNLLTTDASGNIIDAGAKGALASKDTVSAADIAANAVTTEKIADGNVTKAKLDSGVQTSLGLADTALQKATADAAYAVKSTEETATTASTNAQQALTNIGTLTTLTTDAKTNTVAAINEVAGEAAAAQAAADNAQSDVDALGLRVDTAEGEIDGIQTQLGSMATSETIGNLQNLTTTEKTNLVGAINEVDADATKALGDAATAQSAAETAQAAAEAAQTTADAAIPAPDGECSNPTNKCVLTFNNSEYAWEVIERGANGQ